MNLKLEQRIKDYFEECESQHQEHCYASHHADARGIIKDCLEIIERMKYIHAWCQCNIEMGVNVSKFAMEIRNAIEEVGIESDYKNWKE